MVDVLCVRASLRFKKRQHNVTQSMADAAILDEVELFVTAVLHQISGSSERRGGGAGSNGCGVGLFN